MGGIFTCLAIDENPRFYRGERKASVNMKCTTQKSGAKIITSKHNRSGLATALLKYNEEIIFKKDGKNEIKSTAHSKYRCQYHIVFAPKYRRKEIYGTLKKI